MDCKDVEWDWLHLQEQRAYKEELGREIREAEREAREDARQERAQQLEMIGSMIQGQTAFLQKLDCAYFSTAAPCNHPYVPRVIG